MKAIHIFILIISLHFSVDAQVDCPESLDICNGYFYLDGGFESPNTYVVWLSTHDNNFSDLEFTSAVNGVIEFPVVQELSSGGLFMIINNGVTVCEGEFYYNNCKDYLIFPSQRCFAEFPDEHTTCDELGLENSYVAARLCLGDTTHVDISSSKNVIDYDTYLPFSLERLKLNNGTIISYNEYGFDVVWDVLGEECVLLIANTLNNGTATTGVPIVVEPPKKPQIYSNNVDIDSKEICIDENIKLSSNIEDENLLWVISDGREISQKELDISFASPGTYSIILTTGELCSCLIPDTLIVNVLPGETPGIDCTSTICAGNEATYYSEYECDSYQWDVSSEGTVIEGGGPLDSYITILWNSGPTGQVNLTTPGCLEMPCSETVNVEIPIIDGLTNIEGPLVACFGEESYYSIIDFPGTSVKWALEGPGLIYSNKSHNQIKIQWNDESDRKEAILTVTYENCNLECSDTKSIVITLKDGVSIQADVNKYCQEADLILETNLGIIVDWTIIHPDGSESSFNNTPTLNTTLSGVGTYKVSLSNPQSPTCNQTDEISIEILDNPNPPADIEGPTSVCLNKTVQYEIPNLGLYDIVIWEVFDGTLSDPTLTATSRELTYVWTSLSGPYEITAKIQNSITGCISEANALSINSGFILEGSDIACLAQKVTYTVLEYEGGLIDWKIIPSSAGSVIYNQGNSAVVIWLETGTHTVEANYCDNTEMIPVNIPVLDLDVNYEMVCVEEKTEVEVITTSGSTISITQYPETNIVANSLISELGAGEYLVEVTSPYGCYISEEIIITEHDTFDVRISSPGPFKFCMPHPPIPITATDFGIGYTYQWFWNGTLLSENTNTIEATEYGSYYAVVTDENGCSDRSNNISLSEPVFVSGPPLDTEMIDIDCTTKSFSVLAPYESTEFNWSFGDGATSSGTSVDHTYTEAGYYTVGVQGNGGCISVIGMTCDSEFETESCESDRFTVVIPAVANFEFRSSCLGEDIQFFDISSKIPNITGLLYEWDFGDPSSGAFNTSSDVNPTHRFDNAQSYVVRLTLTHPTSGCVTSINKTIIITPKPEVTIDNTSENCLGNSFDFRASSDNPQLTYYWEFGETINGRPQTSRDQNPQYFYSTSGSFLVQLTVKNINGCENTVSQVVTIGQNLLSGEIETNTTYPKCPEESVILTAPQAESYLWSNNETTREITITDPDTYSVTVTDAIGCEYIPFPHLVTDYNISGALIFATKYDELNQSTHYNSLTVCLGQEFTMQTTKLPNAIATWTGENVTGEVSEILDFEKFANLSIGTYDFFVNIVDTVGNCSKDVGPFVLTIVEYPNEPILISDIEEPCEGDVVTISIGNVDPDVIYTWNTGATGTSITTKESGYYSVIATNEYGCNSNRSDFISIWQNPDSGAWLTGCMEVCFPHEICISLRNFSFYKYELVKDGIIIGEFTSTDDFVSIEEPGDYQLLTSTKSRGCATISDILSISAAPDEHTLSGIVYFDENENSTFDGIDQLLENIPVHLYIGNTTIDQTLTDINGYYEFDPVNNTNIVVVIDPSTSELLLEGDLDSLLIYNECIEDKEIDFPLVEACLPIQTDSIYSICPGSSVLIEGVNYVAEETDTITFTSIKGCDSLFIFKIEESLEPEVELESVGSCQDESNGDIIINIVAGQNLLFSIDGGLNYVSNHEFNGLVDGEYVLNILDDNGCVHSTMFSIPLHPLVVFNIESSVVCGSSEMGQVTISPAAEGMQFSLDNNLNFDSSLVYSNVDTGYHMIYAMSIEGCTDSTSFIIESIEEPSIDFVISSSCENLGLGEIMIDSAYLGSLFSLDGIDFSTDLIFTNLEADQYILYYKLDEDCIFEFPFEIIYSPEPILDLSNIASCEGENNGQLIIDTEENSLTFSLNETDIFEDLVIENLSGGKYTLYVNTISGCVYEYPFEIPVLQLPNVDATTENSCFDQETGSIIINSLSEGSSVSINGGEFTDELIYENLKPGTYTIEIKDQQQCSKTKELEILELPELGVEVKEYEDCISEPITIMPAILSGSDPIKYLWNDGSTESQYFADRSELVSVTISDECESLSFEWNLNFSNSINEDNIYVPNIFSPNEDGFNDCFITTLHSDIQLISYAHIIFDRWGNKMFTSDDLNECWDGIYNGKSVVPGVYVYISKFLIEGCEGPFQIRKLGDVTVVR